MSETRLVSPRIWFLPTFWGDIALHRMDSATTRLVYDKLTASEVISLKTLRRRSLKAPLLGSSWATEADFPAIVESGKGNVILHASIEKVQSTISGSLKPDRSLLDVVRFEDGRMIEMSRQAENAPEPTGTPAVSVATPEDAKPDPTPAEKAPIATTVAIPVRGCPAPDFEKAEMRAFGVLCRFLTPNQEADVRRTGAFVSVGADTGHRYKLTNRHAYQLKKGGRTLRDLDEKHDYCVHDWEVPAWEELLAIHCCLSVRGRERLLREIPAV